MTDRGVKRPMARVHAVSGAARRGVVAIGNLRLPCAIGRGGIAARKREGDGASPRGSWPVRCAYYRADRIRRPPLGLAVRPLQPRDGWCDAPADGNYNRPVRHPYPASAERLWRSDGLYDLVLVLGYNDMPRARGRGSAIFMHVARPDLSPTEGCVALGLRDLIKAARLMRPGTRVRIGR
ncbi:MAG: L,D-transpeptidase family protein [Hyphomicrobiaceae bacterium]|nr:L,D-transpeptidase family protein [Hyphomicrobiaceae bacterium]